MKIFRVNCAHTQLVSTSCSTSNFTWKPTWNRGSWGVPVFKGKHGQKIQGQDVHVKTDVKIDVWRSTFTGVFLDVADRKRLENSPRETGENCAEQTWTFWSDTVFKFDELFGVNIWRGFLRQLTWTCWNVNVKIDLTWRGRLTGILPLKFWRETRREFEREILTSVFTYVRHATSNTSGNSRTTWCCYVVAAFDLSFSKIRDGKSNSVRCETIQMRLKL